MSHRYLKFLEELNTLKGNRITIPKKIILKAFEKIYPDLYFSNENFYPQLIKILKKLKTDNLIEFPKMESNWDLNMNPPTPYWIKVVQEKNRKLRNNWRNYPWHPRMLWITKLSTLKKQTFETLIQINNFFINKGEKLLNLVPIKERSIQIFGNEKKLDMISKREWFKKHLPLEDIGCYQTYEPFASKTFLRANTKRAIIIENRDTFDSFCKVNDKMNMGIYRYIVYGCGRLIENTILWMREFDSELEIIEYFGDIDPIGLIIPYNLNHILEENGYNLRVKLATHFYISLINLAKEKFKKLEEKDQISNKLLSFLPHEYQIFVGSLFDKKKRIPQEILNINHIQKVFEKEYTSSK